MLVTAEEAKQKYCLHLVPGEKCRAAECMAWRWFDGEFAPWKRGVLVPEEEHIERIERERSDQEKYRRGYCGLAGKPEVE
jgi:hypothetical protein